MRATTQEELSWQWFHFYTRAHLGTIEITVLSLEAEACYVRLIAVQWETHARGELHLPLDPNHLRALTGKATPQQWKDIWPEIERFFPVTEDGLGRRNESIWEQREDTIAFRAKQAKNGKKGGRPRKPTETHEEPTGSTKPAKRKPNTKPEESGGFSLGSDWVPENGEIGNPTETLKLLAVGNTQSPPPGGGGSFPPPATEGRVLPFGKNSNSDPFAGGDAVDLGALLASIPATCHSPIVELLTQYSRPAKWAQWIDTLGKLVTSQHAKAGPLAVTWEHVAQGLSELLLVNPDGQRITPSVVEIWVKAVPRRALRSSIPSAAAGAPTPTLAPASDPFLEYCLAEARAGNAEYVEICTANGLMVAQESA